MKIINNNSKERGFIILFAILISAVMLLISVGIFNVVQKQSILSSFSRESQRAFYAADAALECALQNDLNPPTVDGSQITMFPYFDDTGANTTIECSENNSITAYAVDSGSGSVSNFEIAYGFNHQSGLGTDDPGCAFVLVEKTLDDSVTPNQYDTRITAVGFNRCDDDGLPNYDDPNILERRLSARYMAI